MIVKRENKFVVMDSEGKKVLGTHSTKEQAEKQLTAIHISQKKRKSLKEFLEETSQLTLQYHDQLNPNLWENNKLKEEVRNKLLQIADVWTKFAKIPAEAIEDVLVVGGNANFNYTPYSDIDLHILVDKSKIADCPEILDEYLKDKKQLWAHSHDIKIYSHDVEIYAQDISEQVPANQGSYSLTQNEWLNEPKQEEINLEDPEISLKVNELIHKIEGMISSKASDESFTKLKEKFRTMRSAGLKKAGEFSVENLVFKELRNRGYLDKVNDYILSTQDENLSLKN
jgi:DNA-binding Lrp family transcriptional regulator